MRNTAMSWISTAGGTLRDVFGWKPEVSTGPKVEPDLLIVRRGMSPAFYFFCRLFAKEHGLRVVEDRRAGERRQRQRATASINRRRSDRRKTESQWVKTDFLVIRDPRNGSSEDVAS